MKLFILLVALVTLTAGCSKEAAINSKLKGTWDLGIKGTFWQNGFPTAPQVNETPNWGTMTLDKKGNGTISPYNGTQADMTVTHIFDGGEKFQISDETNSYYYYISWSLDKKSFTLFNRGMDYGSNTNPYQVYSESILTCHKK